MVDQMKRLYGEERALKIHTEEEMEILNILPKMGGMGI